MHINSSPGDIAPSNQQHLSVSTPTSWDASYKRAAQISILLSALVPNKCHDMCLLKPHQCKSHSYNVRILIVVETKSFFLFSSRIMEKLNFGKINLIDLTETVFRSRITL